MTKSKFNPQQAVMDLTVLAQEFPACFTINSPQPLKRNIKRDIISYWARTPKLTKSKLQQALFFYTNSAAYLQALKREPVRVDLEGNPDEEIILADRNEAHARYQTRYGKNKRKIRHMN